MNLISALQTLQDASKSDVTISITATLVTNAEQPLLTIARVACMVSTDGKQGFGEPKWTAFEAPNLELAVAKAMEALCPR